MSVNSTPQMQKQLHTLTQTHQKQKQLLLQQIQFLSQELQEYKQRELDTKKINESIMITYQQNQNIREEHITKQLKLTKQKYEQQFTIYKQQMQKRCKTLQENIIEYKNKYEYAMLENERKAVEFEKKLVQIKRKYQRDIRAEGEEKEKQYEAKVQILKEKLKQAESMAEVYQEFVNKRRENYGYYGVDQQENVEDNGENYLLENQKRRETLHHDESNKLLKSRQSHQSSHMNPSRKDRLRNIQQNNKNDLRRLSASRQSVRLLTQKIDRAVVQLKTKGSDKYGLHERINQKLMKRLM